MRFEAVLSDGSKVVEGEGEYVKAKVLPWRKLCQDLAVDQKYIDALSLVMGEGKVYLPGAHKFGGAQPSHYSLQYQCDMDDVFGEQKQTHYVDLAAHYNQFKVHFITDGVDAWITVDNDPRMCESPVRKE